MRFSHVAVAALAAGFIGAAAPQEAIARTASFSRTFNTPQGTFSQSGMKSFNPSTGAASESVTTTGPKGAVQSQSFSRTPDGKGGVTVTKSFTSFSGKTQTVTHKFGP